MIRNLSVGRVPPGVLGPWSPPGTPPRLRAGGVGPSLATWPALLARVDRALDPRATALGLRPAAGPVLGASGGPAAPGGVSPPPSTSWGEAVGALYTLANLAARDEGTRRRLLPTAADEAGGGGDGSGGAEPAGPLRAVALILHRAAEAAERSREGGGRGGGGNAADAVAASGAARGADADACGGAVSGATDGAVDSPPDQAVLGSLWITINLCYGGGGGVPSRLPRPGGPGGSDPEAGPRAPTGDIHDNDDDGATDDDDDDDDARQPGRPSNYFPPWATRRARGAGAGPIPIATHTARGAALRALRWTEGESPRTPRGGRAAAETRWRSVEESARTLARRAPTQDQRERAGTALSLLERA